MAQVSTPPERMMHRSLTASESFGPPVRLDISVSDCSKIVRKVPTLLEDSDVDIVRISIGYV